VSIFAQGITQSMPRVVCLTDVLLRQREVANIGVLE
jgi:hypothetical protein